MFLFRRHATVHPVSTSSTLRQENKEDGAYGSWCTPKSSPAHPPVKQSNSNVETKTERQNVINAHRNQLIYDEICRIIQTPPPSYINMDGIEPPFDVPQEKKKKRMFKNPSKESDPEKEGKVEATESPQSPVPNSPKREKSCIGFLKIPAFCDPLAPIDPQGGRYITWLFLVTLCYSYNAWCIALRATFPYQTPENTPYWMMADYFADLVYLIDVALVKPRLMFLHEGFWVDDTNETRKKYRLKLQYKFDIISLMPLDLLYIIYGTDKVILRLPRLLKLQTFWEFHQAMDRILSSPYVVRIGKTLFYIFYLIHLNACAYYTMSSFEGIGSNGWVYDGQGNAYIRCFYFATKTATSIGKNPKPENQLEYLFMTAAWLMGVFVFALLIGQIRDIIATATRARTEYRKHVDGCSTYLRKLNMPQHLQRRLAAWFDYTWRQQRCFDESKLMNTLPFNMKRDVALAVHMNILSKVEIFRDCSASLLRDLVLQLKPESFLPGDVIVRSGDVGHHMYIIKSGECYVMSPDDSEVVATLSEGSVFGEISLMGIEGLRRRTATVRSRGFSNLFALSKFDLDAALKHHKEAAQVLRRRADQLIRENAARQEEKRAAARLARRSASTVGDNGSVCRRRRVSTVSSNDSSARERRRQRIASAHRSRLAVVDEDKVGKSEPPTTNVLRTPIPTIIFSSD